MGHGTMQPTRRVDDQGTPFRVAVPSGLILVAGLAILTLAWVRSSPVTYRLAFSASRQVPGVEVATVHEWAVDLQVNPTDVYRRDQDSENCELNGTPRAAMAGLVTIRGKQDINPEPQSACLHPRRHWFEVLRKMDFSLEDMLTSLQDQLIHGRPNHASDAIDQ